MRVLVLAVFTLLWSVVLASSDAAFRPALYPLAIRTPYLQAWSNLTAFVAVDSSNNLWPNFWTDSRVLGWEGFLRVDNVAYKWIGGTAGYDIATFLNATMTPTRTIWTAKAGNMDVTITALSPIETSDLAKQSFPFVYISVNASSTDGQSHDVQVYMDISAEWVSGVDDVVVEWNTTQTSTSIYHQVYRQTKASMTETGGVADDSTAYIGMRSVSGLTWQTGEDTTCRGLFNETGALGNSADTDYRDIDTDWPVFAFSVDLGSISSTPSPTVFTIGLLRNPSIEVSYNGTEMRMPYFLLQESSIPDAIDTFLDDYEDASSRADALDEALMSAANSISSEFADLVALSTRQVMAGMEITLPSGATNASDVRIFMQNTGIDQRVDPVDTMFSAWPAILYLNASWASYILEPLLVYQSSSSYTYDYAANDLGTSFPVATGDSLQSDLGIENCGDMLIMALAHARVTGDGSLLSKYYTLFRKWGEYLVSNLPSPSSSQTASNNVSGGNSTNLAIKGIIAVKAMSVISHALGNTEDADIFASNATSLYNQWVKLSAGDNFLVEYYGNSSSWELMYNLYADKLLGTGVVADSVCIAS
ncbi:hypothetical protein FISHEDRAFT_40022 [Fistulina hepatica ATCC 64428]|uniref:DUF1793-domain-containing protein n=1 Tax=Fistulina hepatica ATCC 64428 TaxID=1128425 RepID=A0A0D7AFG5_9AGAR|nr:hypothetical protein FISHEDRAFT_40022 [Fistulina hepatica ATCC 64428]